MQKYTDLIEDTHDLITGRERIEWSNFWYDCTNREEEHRILLVGDSTMRMVRSTFAEEMNCAVDLLGTSSGLHDILLAKQMDFFFCSSQYKYDCIFVQLGHHSRIGENGLPYTEQDYERFAQDYKALVTYLKQYCERIVLVSVFYSVIPFNRYTHFSLLDKGITVLRRFCSEKYNDEINDVKRRKNEIIKKISEDFKMQFCDINAFMLDLSKNYKTLCLHTDHVHFEEKAKKVIVNEYKKYLS